jgi:hypothetical protein
MLTPLARGPEPPTIEWLSPGTAKAFAAAGSFDGERDGSGAEGLVERLLVDSKMSMNVSGKVLLQ